MDTVHLPKIDLHCHIDGSFSFDFIKKHITKSYSDEELLRQIKAPADCKSLTEYLRCFDLPISCMQTKENITEGVLNILENCAKENVVYVELRFAPYFSLNDSLTYPDILEAAIKGCQLGLKHYGIYSNIIVCAMRHLSSDINICMLRAAREFLNEGVCALDLAGDESHFNNELFYDLFKEARRLNMPFTIHSGECGSINNIKLALEYGASRIGHGIALLGHTDVMHDCKKKSLGLELCPTSNYQTKALLPGDTYPLRSFLDNGLLATINTDNRTVSDTTLTKEYEFALRELDIHEEDLSVIYRNSIAISFADDSIKHELIKKA